MSVWDITSHQTVTEAELLEGQNLDEALLTKLGSNQEYSEAERIKQVNAWTKNDDIWDHFSVQPLERSSTADRKPAVVQETCTWDEDNHLMTLGSNLRRAIWTTVRHRADKVETIFEARVKVEQHGANPSPFAGFTDEGDASTDIPDMTSAAPNNGVYFQRGTNANTWRCISRSANVTRSDDDNKAGNYIDWDLLRIDYYTAGAKFYINGTLVATHTIVLPDTVLLRGFVHNVGGTVLYTKCDWLSFRAIANDDSP